ncbi:hypothetical protein LTS18_007132, partial [Coniosporium uncinatum]
MSSLDASRNTVKHPASQETGFFIFRNLIKGIPLAAEGEEQHVKIKYFELWNDNLYIGTTAAEILHFVGIPPDPGDELGQPSFILASRSFDVTVSVSREEQEGEEGDLGAFLRRELVLPPPSEDGDDGFWNEEVFGRSSPLPKVLKGPGKG